MQTEITRLLGIKYPIIQGGMASGSGCFRSRWSWTYWCRQCSGRVGARADTLSTQADGQTIWSEYYAYEPLCG